MSLTIPSMSIGTPGGIVIPTGIAETPGSARTKTSENTAQLPRKNPTVPGLAAAFINWA
jgi:hypothetical protein